MLLLLVKASSKYNIYKWPKYRTCWFLCVLLLRSYFQEEIKISAEIKCNNLIKLMITTTALNHSNTLNRNILMTEYFEITHKVKYSLLLRHEYSEKIFFENSHSQHSTHTNDYIYAKIFYKATLFYRYVDLSLFSKRSS